MFKNIIGPIQAWLLSQGKCVGCGKALKDMKNRKQKGKGEELIICECSRVFVHTIKTNIYRRARLDEA